RRQLGRAAAGRPGGAARARGAGPVGLHLRRRPGAVAVGHPEYRGRAGDTAGARRGQPDHAAGLAAAKLGGWAQLAALSWPVSTVRDLARGQLTVMLKKHLTRGQRASEPRAG